MGLGLGDQHAVEGIAERPRQASRPNPIGKADHQFRKSLRGHTRGKIGGDINGAGQFADADFGGNFPSRGGADEYAILLIGFGLWW